MRLTWFSGLSPARRRSARRRRSAANGRGELRVRQLERRRVLDAALASLVVSPTVVVDDPGVTTTDTAQEPLVFDWSAAETSDAADAPSAEPDQSIGAGEPQASVGQSADQYAFETLAAGGAQASAASDGGAGSVAPVLIVAVNQTVDEGEELDLSGMDGASPLGFFSDPDSGETYDATVDWGDGTVEAADMFPVPGFTALGGKHTYDDNGTYTVTVTVDDNNGGTDTGTFQVTVNNVAPTATFENDGPVVEGTGATVSFSSQFDPGVDDTSMGLRYSYDLDNDGTFDIGDGTYGGSVTNDSQAVAAGFLPDGPGSHTVLARIIDKDGDLNDYTTTIDVSNVAPQFTDITGDTINEGDVATIGATIVDPGAGEAYSVSVDWMDGSSDTISGLGATDTSGTQGSTSYTWDADTRRIELSHQYLDDGPGPADGDPSYLYSVELVVSDGDDTSGIFSAEVQVDNVQPVLNVAAPQTVNEGDLLDLSGMSGASSLGFFLDDGILDTHTATVDWGDGTLMEMADVVQGAGFGALGGSHTYADNGAYLVTVRVTDDDGDFDEQTFTVTVENVNPTLTVPGPQTIVEGNELSLTDLGTITDPGFDHSPLGTVETFTYWINWGDGTIETGTATIDDVGGVMDLTEASFDGAHTYADNDNYTVIVRVADDDMSGDFVSGMADIDFVEQAFEVTVDNDPPVVTLGSVTSITENGVAELSGSIDDDGSLDTFTLDVTWGDPLSPNDTQTFALGTVALTEAVDGIDWDPMTRSFTVKHQYLDDNPSGDSGNTYTIDVTVTDDDTDVGTAMETVLVGNDAPVVTLGSVTSITENGVAELSGSIDDDGSLDTFTLDVTWGDPLSPNDTQSFALGTVALTEAVDGIDWDPMTRTFTVKHQYLDDNPTATASDTYTINVTVTDDDTDFGTAMETVLVGNDAPVVTLGSVTSISENGVAELSGSIDDDGSLDTFTLDVTWGDPLSPNDTQTFALGTVALTEAVDGIDWDPVTRTFTVQHQYLDDNPSGSAADTYTINVTVTDDDTESGTDSETVLVSNLNPAVALNAVAGINENGVATLSGAITDTGSLDTFTLDVTWGDSLSPPNTQSFALGTTTLTIAANGIDWNPTTRTFSVQHQYLDDNPSGSAADTYTINVTVTDDDTESGTDSETVLVSNLNPAVALNAVAGINENGVATLSGAITDTGSLDTFTLDVTWGDSLSPPNTQSFALGTTTLTIAANGIDWNPTTRTFSVQHQYLDDNPSGSAADTYTINVTVTDDDTESGTDSETVLVSNLNPAVALNAVAGINENGVATLSGAITDTGSLDTFTLDVIWGDSLSPPNTQSFALGTTTLTIAANGIDWNPITRTFTVQHQYLDDNPSGSAADTYTINVTVTDDDTESGTDSETVLVSNLNPAVALNAVAGINENGVATLSGAITDTGSLDTFTLDVTWGDSLSPPNTQSFALGTTTLTIAANGIDWNPTTRTFSVQHQYLDDNPSGSAADTYTINVTVTDDDTESGTDSETVLVSNLNPAVALNAVAGINENGVATLSGAITDTGSLDTFTLDVTWGDSLSPPNTQSFALGTTTLTIAANGIDWNPTTRTFSVQHQYLDDNPSGSAADTYTINVTVTDDDTESGTDSETVLVSNLNPAVALNAVAGINENGVATLSGAITDTGSLDTFTLDVIWGDSLSPPNTQSFALGTTTLTIAANGIDWNPITRTFTVQHQYLDDNPSGSAADTYTINVTVTDDDTESGTDSETVLVSNLNPAVALNAVAGINENGVATLSGAITDTGSLDTFTLDVTWGDSLSPPNTQSFALGTTTLTIAANGIDWNPTTRTFSVQHQYLDDNPSGSAADTYTINVTVTDDDTESGTDSETVLVSNLNPVLSVPGAQSIDEGSDLPLADLGSFTDVGTLDLHKARINWGDGHIEDVVVVQSAGSGIIVGNHTYADDGVYTAVLRLADDDMGAYANSALFVSGTLGVDYVEKTFTVTVENVAPALTVTPSPTSINEGSTVTFNAAFEDFGFDNPLNPTTPSDGLPLNESFRYYLNWGDGRDIIATQDVSDVNGSPGVKSTGTFNGSHTYADDGSYTLTVRLADDNMGAYANSALFVTGTLGVDYVEKTFTVTVENVAPALTVTPSPTSINEGSTVTFNAAFEDFGFDNPLNPTTPSDGLPLNESFRYYLNWGDGRDIIATQDVSDVNGSPGVKSTGTFNGSHTYADDGSYTLTVRLADDNMGAYANSALFVTGTLGVDYVEKTFTVTVENVVPALTVTPSPTSINEGSTVTFNAAFEDFGFDNPLNPTTPSDGLQFNESFRYYLNWGDGRDIIGTQDVADVNGSPGVKSTGTFNGSHTYADDGSYTLTVRLADDNMGAYANSALFVTGTLGVDYVQRTFVVTVSNVQPTLTGTANLTINEGQAFTLNDLGVGLDDFGFDNPLNPTTPSQGDPLRETFAAHTINWGDGRGPIAVSIDNVNDRVSGSPGVKTTATFTHSAYTYADDGLYTVTIRLADDNMGAFSDPAKFTTGVAGVDYIDRTLVIRVNNIVPTITGVTPTATSIDEAGSVTFEAQFSDFGFDNSLNPNGPEAARLIFDPRSESFRYYVNWGDGRHLIQTANVADLNGAPGVKSTGTFSLDHIFPDDGVYTVTIRLADDNMSAFTDSTKFGIDPLANTTGVDGVDFVEWTFEVTVDNIAPEFVPQPNGASFQGDELSSAGITAIRGSYSDVGFDNLANPNSPAPPSITDTLHESFSHIVNWGDGTVDAIHTYVDSGVYTVTVTVSGPGGNQTFTFADFDSSMQPVLTLVSSQSINNPSVIAQTYTYVINWGDGAEQTIQLSLKTPGNPLFNNGLTTVFSVPRTSGDEGVLTTGSFEIQHRYLGPPNPSNPTADIMITLTVVDDNNATVSDFVLVSNPGIETNMVAIDTTPQVPRLDFAPPAPPQALLDQGSSSFQSLQTTDTRVASAESATTSDRYLVLVVISPDGKETESHLIKDEALLDLKGLFATLPENHYRIYLVRTETNARRLVIEVSVRRYFDRVLRQWRGRVVDPADDSEGTRDRPPTSEATLPIDHTAPLDQNPMLEPLTKNGDTSSESQATNNETPLPAIEAESPQPPVPGPRFLRWSAPLVGLALGACGGNWSQRLDEALRQADERAWQRLRRAGRQRRRTASTITETNGTQRITERLQ